MFWWHTEELCALLNNAQNPKAGGIMQARKRSSELFLKRSPYGILDMQTFYFVPSNLRKILK